MAPSVLGVHMTGDGHRVVMLINYSATKESDAYSSKGDSSVAENIFAIISLDVLKLEVWSLYSSCFLVLII